jgi:thiol-disulfide isomerase/thioredoxin
MFIKANRPRSSMPRFGLAVVFFAVAAHFRESSGAEQSQGVTVMCVNKDGKPVAGAEVHLFQSVVGEPGRYKHFGPFAADDEGLAACPRAVVSDGQGHFDRWAYARIPGRLVGVGRSANWKKRAPINPELRVELQPSRSVEGFVTVPGGFDPTQVLVHTQVLHIKTGPGNLDFQGFPRHLPFDGLDKVLADVFDKHPDAEGHIRFDDVPVQGSLYLLTVADGLGEAQWRNSNNAFDEPIRLTISKEAILTGRVVSPEGKPAVGLTVSARLSITPEKQVFHLSTFRAQTDEQGHFIVHGLPETPFVLSVEDPSHQWIMGPRENLRIAAGESKDAEVEMEIGVAVSGSVIDTEGDPVEGAALSALADTQIGSGLAHDTSDRDGRYRLRLPSGRARLYFNSLPDGFVYPDPQIIARLDITAGQNPIEGLDFTISTKPGQPARKDDRPARPAVAKEKKPNALLGQRVGAIAQEHAERERTFYEDLKVAKNDDQKVSDLNRRYQAEKREQAEELMSLIAEHAADAEAFDAVLVLVGEMRYPLDDSFTAIVLEHHLTDADMGRLCFALRYRGGEAWAARILKAVADKHPQRHTRGQAHFALGDYYRDEAFGWGRDVLEAKKSALLANASRYYQQTVEEFAETLTPDGKSTLGEKAKHELTRLKNLPDLQVGRPAPPIAGEALDGKPMSLADHRGRVVLLVFWGSWCGPCMRMVPHERELAERYRDKPCALVGVNCGDTREVAVATMEKNEMTWRCWWDGEETRGPIETDYDVPHWPRVFVVDADGIICAIDPEADELDRTVDKLLQAEAD